MKKILIILSLIVLIFAFSVNIKATSTLDTKISSLMSSKITYENYDDISKEYNNLTDTQKEDVKLYQDFIDKFKIDFKDYVDSYREEFIDGKNTITKSKFYEIEDMVSQVSLSINYDSNIETSFYEVYVKYQKALLESINTTSKDTILLKRLVPVDEVFSAYNNICYELDDMYSSQVYEEAKFAMVYQLDRYFYILPDIVDDNSRNLYKTVNAYYESFPKELLPCVANLEEGKTKLTVYNKKFNNTYIGIYYSVGAFLLIMGVLFFMKKRKFVKKS